MDSSIFKAYDVRGTYPDQINEGIAYKIGRAFGQIIKEEYSIQTPKITVGHDMRTSSPALKDMIIKGLLVEGVEVTDVGLVTTPTFYFSVGYYKNDGGIQVSASHNPKEFNGFKMVGRNSEPIGGESTAYVKLQKLVKSGEFAASGSTGKLTQREGVVKEEVKVQREGIDYQKIKPFKIVLETGNGSGALDFDAMFEGLPCTLTKVNYEIDGTFPVHTPDPLKEENMKWGLEGVKSSGADLGIVSDGDCDRIFFIDEKGETVPQPILRGLMAQIELKKNAGAKVCYDIRPGRITKEMIEEVGGEAIVTRVGHSFIKEKMIETGAIFGGESSGHYYYKFPYGIFEAPVVFVYKLLTYLSEVDKPLSEILAPYKKYFHSGEINSKVTDKEAKMKQIKQMYSDGEINKLDGLTFTFPEYWFNVRPSNTENLLRFTLEAKSKEIMETKRDEILEIIRS